MTKGLSRLLLAVLVVGMLPGAPSTARAATPAYTVTPLVAGLTVPWDVTFIGDVMLFDERPGRV